MANGTVGSPNQNVRYLGGRKTLNGQLTCEDDPGRTTLRFEQQIGIL